MRRPFRIVSNVVTTASAGLFLATVALFLPDWCCEPNGRTAVCFREGDLQVWRNSPGGRGSRRVFDPYALRVDEQRWFVWFRFQRIEWHYGENSPVWPYLPADAKADAGPSGIVVTKAYECDHARMGLLVLFGIIPLIRVCIGHRRAVRRAFRVEHRLCTDCGYDLQGTPGCCPECGTVPRWAAERSQEVPGTRQGLPEGRQDPTGRRRDLPEASQDPPGGRQDPVQACPECPERVVDVLGRSDRPSARRL